MQARYTASVKRVFLAFREAGIRFSRDGCGFLAQAVAFNSLFALFPLFVLATTVASYVFPIPEHRVYAIVQDLAPQLRGYIENSVHTYMYGRGVSSLVAIAFLVWSGKNLFMALAYALDRAIGVPKGRPLVHNIARSLIILPIIGIMLIVAMALPIILSVALAVAKLPDSRHMAQLSGYIIALALVFVVTLTLYAFLPNRKLSWRFGVPGAIFAASIWPVVQFAFAQYTIRVNFTAIYGALSAPLVLLLWFYLVGSIFLFGAELCTAWASQTGTERVPTLIDQLDPITEDVS
jgi:membrane protein